MRYGEDLAGWTQARIFLGGVCCSGRQQVFNLRERQPTSLAEMASVPQASNLSNIGQPMTETTKFEEWAVLELFGHQRLAGLVSEFQLGGASFVRVDVPGNTKKSPTKLTKMYNPSAIYSICPVTEETARMVAKSVSGEPVARWDVQEMVREAKRALRPAPEEEEMNI